jgi:hypothetical protein
MYTLSSVTRAIALGSMLFLAACSPSEGTASTNFSLKRGKQDLKIDPSGHTTVFTFTSDPSGSDLEAYQANGGQTAQSVSYTGDRAEVTWDERVSPSDEVRFLGESYSSDWVEVATSDSSATTFAITSATQVGLGEDAISVTVSGPWLIPSEVEDPANWSYTVSGYAQDFSGAGIVYDAVAGSISFTLGEATALHESFTLTPSVIKTVAEVSATYDAMSGVSAGDSVAPMLLAVEQNLSVGEYGTVIDFTFDEEMDPFFCMPSSYYYVEGNLAFSVTQAAGDTIRVSYSQPVIPGVDTVTVSPFLMDLRGNGLNNSGTFAVTQPSLIENTFTSECVVSSVENQGGDTLTAYMTQSLDVQSAMDPNHWELTIGGSVIPLAGEHVSYDFENRIFSVSFGSDLEYGSSWELVCLSVLEVDGEYFTGSCSGSVIGDDVTPYIVDVVQNRVYDATGATLEVSLSEDCSELSALDVGNWSVSSGVIVNTVSFLSGSRVLRLTCDSIVMPGADTLTCNALVDFAGNAMGSAQAGIEVTSTDTSAPVVAVTFVSAYEGAWNDEIFVVFSESMYAVDCEDSSKWSFESPIGTPQTLSNASFSYDDTHRTCAVTFGAATGVNLKRGDDFVLTFDTVRDLGGNSLSGDNTTGLVIYETSQPLLVDCWRESSGDAVVLRFSEPCDWTGDLFGATRYVLRDGGGDIVAGAATSTTTQDQGLGVRVEFDVMVQPDYTIDVSGITDLAGNHLYPALGKGLSVEDSSAPGFMAGATVLTVVSGENNDTVVILFDRMMSPWGITDPSNYTLSTGGEFIDLSGAKLNFDGDRFVWMTLGRNTTGDLQDGASYTVTVENVQTAQGVIRGVADIDIATAAGDSSFPTAFVGDVRLDPLYPSCVLLHCSEALDPVLTADPSQFALNGVLASASEMVSPRCCRVTFDSTPAALDQVSFTLSDLAGNTSFSITRAVVAADVTPPVVLAVEGVAISGYGGDWITVSFDEDLDANTYFNPWNYIFLNGSQLVSLGTADFEYDSSARTVKISLGTSVELDPNFGITAIVSGVMDCSGNIMTTSAGSVSGSCTGDFVAPWISDAFVNYRADSSGAVVEVRFNEDVDSSYCADPMNWDSSGGVFVADVEPGDGNSCTLYLLQPLEEGQSLELTAGLKDAANNTAGALSFTPLF